MFVDCAHFAHKFNWSLAGNNIVQCLHRFCVYARWNRWIAARSFLSSYRRVKGNYITSTISKFFFLRLFLLFWFYIFIKSLLEFLQIDFFLLKVSLAREYLDSNGSSQLLVDGHLHLSIACVHSFIALQMRLHRLDFKWEFWVLAFTIDDAILRCLIVNTVRIFENWRRNSRIIL